MGNLEHPCWLIFGVGSPEERFLGTHLNAGAAVIDLLAERGGRGLKEIGPIQSAILVGEDATVRLVKPNVVPGLVETAITLCKTKVRFDENKVVLIYGDPAYDAGAVKIKRKGGLAGNRAVEEFNRTFGHKQVIRIRVGIGPSQPKGIVKDLDANAVKLIKGIHVAAAAIQTLIEYGYSEASDLANKASKGKVIV